MPYEFNIEEFNRFSNEVIKAEGDQATLTTLLADMQGTVTDAIARDVAATERVAQIEAENERLRQANMTLFLRVGTDNNQTNQEPAKPAEHMTTKAYMQKYFNALDEK